MDENKENNISTLGYPALPWLPDYVKYVFLDGESILPYMCKTDKEIKE